VGSYLGLIPAEASSGKHQQQMGHVTKQGNTLLRWLLVEAAIKAQSKDPNWHRQYLRLSMNKHQGVAKVAIAHKLAVRLYWMLRSGENYTQVMERGSHAGRSVQPNGCGLKPIAMKNGFLIRNEAQKKHLSFVPRSIVAVVGTGSRVKINAKERRP
jgi:Transposase IS116/IS110/IS902 family